MITLGHLEEKTGENGTQIRQGKSITQDRKGGGQGITCYTSSREREAAAIWKAGSGGSILQG